MRNEIGSFALGALVAVVLLGTSTALVLRDDGIQFTDGTVQTTAAMPNIRIVDSMGQTIGPALARSPNGSVPTYLKLGVPAEVVAFTIEADTYMLPGSGNLLFTGPNCTGDAYFAPGPQQQWWTNAWYGFGSAGVLYRATDPGFPTTFDPPSKIQGTGNWKVGDTSDRCVTDPDFPSDDGYPATQFADLSTLPFVPDFRLE